MMLKSTVRVLARVSPRLGTLVRQSYLTLNGWRFDEFKQFIESTHQDSSAAFQAQHSLKRLASEAPRRQPSIAVISAMPPADAGIATFTHATFAHANYGVDIYAPYGSIDDYLSAVYDERLNNSNVRVFSIEALPFGRTQNSYEAQLFCLGNSTHNMQVLYALKKLKHFSANIRTFLHLHDPCLFNVLSHFCRNHLIDLEGTLRSHYPPARAMDLSGVRIGDCSDLIARGILGLKAIIHDVPLDGIIVNSQAAADLVLRDYADFPAEKILRLFHPVFPQIDAGDAACEISNRLGTFGIPDEGSKGTNIIIDAFRLLRQSMPDIELVIAGYLAQEFAQRMRLGGEQGLIIEDAPGLDRLEALMRTCRLGIQLRLRNLGESSGVVPQLLSAGVPVITSPVGAFLEYGDAVTYTPPEVTPAQLAELIREELGAPDRRRDARRAYVSDRTPGHFCARLMEIVTARKSPQ